MSFWCCLLLGVCMYVYVVRIDRIVLTRLWSTMSIMTANLLLLRRTTRPTSTWRLKEPCCNGAIENGKKNWQVSIHLVHQSIHPFFYNNIHPSLIALSFTYPPPFTIHNLYLPPWCMTTRKGRSPGFTSSQLFYRTASNWLILPQLFFLFPCLGSRMNIGSFLVVISFIQNLISTSTWNVFTQSPLRYT